jgi:hypothetical protein
MTTLTWGGSVTANIRVLIALLVLWLGQALTKVEKVNSTLDQGWRRKFGLVPADFDATSFNAHE